MKRTGSLFVSLAIAPLAAATLLAGSAALTTVSAKEITLRLSYFGGANGSTWADVMKPWYEAINKEGKGILKIEPYAGGALVPSPRAQVKALTDGVADIAFVVFSYTPGRFPDNDIMELPTLYNDVRESSHVIRALYEKGMLRGYDKFYVPFLVTTYPYNFHTSKPVKKLSDLKGMKLRAGGPVAGAALRAIGVAPVGMPITVVAENISKGVLDGTATDWNVMYSFRINDVAKNHYMQLFSTVPIGMMMTKEKFNGLPKNVQALIQKYSGKWIDDLFVKTTTAQQDTLLAKIKADKSHTIVIPDAADRAAYNKIMAGVVTKWVKGNPNREKMLAVAQDELKKLRLGK
ncbi:MAG: TRAP transporter substrate-binding protein [Beijerinckiaceae bacterium]|jgi:TRAP-type transport system periplasmic protein|nr:TRAP transporter substrate-binding protein [Beijerinckiaceae bacterium]